MNKSRGSRERVRKRRTRYRGVTMNKSREENRRDCMRVTAFNRIFHNPPAYPHWMSVTMPSMAISDETRCYAIHGASGIRHFTCRQAHPAPSPVLTETLAQFPSLLDSPACSTQRNSICNSLPSPFAIFLKNSTDGL